ncbi:SRPBCC domain-containing protein [Candidatus Pacearchaeota archaeon]|nr:SRPBCC domain-containing protein [Candidatus Pacearchaeota archaeon]
MRTKTIRQTVVFKASPDEVYNAIMDPKKHAEFTGSKARISRDVGGKFSVYGGYIDGKNIELIPGKKIVQTWHANEWPEGHYSKVTFIFKKVKQGTKMIFIQEGVPDEHYENIRDGWKEHYWDKMKSVFGW